MTNIQQLRETVTALQTAYDQKATKYQAIINYERNHAEGLGHTYDGPATPAQYQDTNGRSILLDALTTLVHAQATLAMAEPELGHYLIELHPEHAKAANDIGESPEEYTYRALDRRTDEHNRPPWKPETGPTIIHETTSFMGQPIRLRTSAAGKDGHKAVAWLSTSRYSSGTHMTREECYALAAMLTATADAAG